jgi:hypothetical protein
MMKKTVIAVSATLCAGAIVSVVIPRTVLDWFGVERDFVYCLFDPDIQPPDRADFFRHYASLLLIALVSAWTFVGVIKFKSKRQADSSRTVPPFA